MSEDTYRFELDVPAEAIDELGHVGNAYYLTWILEAARRHSTAAGFVNEPGNSQGAVFVVRRHEIDYLKPAMPGDRLRIETWIASWKSASSERRSLISRAADGEPLCRALTRWVYIDERSRPRRIPPELAAAFAEATRNKAQA